MSRFAMRKPHLFIFAFLAMTTPVLGGDASARIGSEAMKLRFSVMRVLLKLEGQSNLYRDGRAPKCQLSPTNLDVCNPVIDAYVARLDRNKTYIDAHFEYKFARTPNCILFEPRLQHLFQNFEIRKQYYQVELSADAKKYPNYFKYQNFSFAEEVPEWIAKAMQSVRDINVDCATGSVRMMRRFENREIGIR